MCVSLFFFFWSPCTLPSNLGLCWHLQTPSWIAESTCTINTAFSRGKLNGMFLIFSLENIIMGQTCFLFLHILILQRCTQYVLTVVIAKLPSYVQLFETPWTVAHQTPQSMSFPRQEYSSSLPFPSPGDLPYSGIEPQSPALQTDSLLDTESFIHFDSAPCPAQMRCSMTIYVIKGIYLN